MTIWTFSEPMWFPEFDYDRKTCLFCNEPLHLLVSDKSTEEFERLPQKDRIEFDVSYRSLNIRTCPLCGWWTGTQFGHDFIRGWLSPPERLPPMPHRGYCDCEIDDYLNGRVLSDDKQKKKIVGEEYTGRDRYYTRAGTAILKRLDLADIQIPVEDVRQYLTVKYADRFKVHPRKFEEVVGSVFQDHGFDVQVTAYSGDDGLDVILTKDAETIGVQVKRYKDRIGVEQIRSLTGALVLNGLTKGVYLTTSSFQRGAERTCERLKHRGYAIELIDGERFLNALGIAQRNAFKVLQDFPVQEAIKNFSIVDIQVG